MVLSLSNALLHNTTLKSLNLSSNWEITNSGWTALSISLREMMLEKISIRSNFIDNIGITVIAESLENNSSLRELDLSDNLICEDGVSALATVLRHPNFALTSLHINENTIGDIGINALTDALLHNSMLKELSIYDNPDITPIGWANFSNVLRNPTSRGSKSVV
jgi:hypothetical protein